MDFSTSKTKENLLRAFSGESQARNRYNISAQKALTEGYYAIYKVFDLTASQEQAHATVFYNYLKEFSGTEITIDAAYPIDIYETTLEYLRAAATNEDKEHKIIYQQFGNTAKDEGFIQIAQSFYSIAEIENTHYERFNMLATQLGENRLYKTDTDSLWVCTNCGHIHTGPNAPNMCPVCLKTQGYFFNKNCINIF